MHFIFRQEAHDIIRDAVHTSEDDVVIFTDDDSTSALDKLIHLLDLEEPPIVFVGSNEHHSLLSPWREVGAKVSTYHLYWFVNNIFNYGFCRYARTDASAKNASN